MTYEQLMFLWGTVLILYLACPVGWTILFIILMLKNMYKDNKAEAARLKRRKEDKENGIVPEWKKLGEFKPIKR